MAKPITIPNTFANATTAIPLSQLDNNYSTITSSINDANTYSNYAADSGAANAYAITLSGVSTTYTAGLRIQFKAANANSGASTLNVNSQGVKNIILTDGSTLPANAIVANALVDVMYDGTSFQLLSDSNGSQETVGNLAVTGNLTVTGTSGFTGNVTANVATVTTMAGNPSFSGNVTISGTNTNVANLNASGNAAITGTASFTGNVSANTVTVTSLSDSGNLTFTGTGNRITGDFSNATIASRVAFQSSTTNGQTIPIAFPNGTSGTAGFAANSSSSDPANASEMTAVVVGASDVRFSSAIRGTGTYLPMTFYTGGSERMRIIGGTGSDVGYVGIGTSSPSARLSVTSAGDGTFNSQIVVAPASGANPAKITFNPTTSSAIAGLTDGSVAFYGNGANTERMRIDSSGNVGIGTASPSAKLDVITGTNSGISVSDGTYTGTFVPSSLGGMAITTGGAYPLISYINGAERMRIDSSGNLLVGTTSQIQFGKVSVSGAGSAYTCTISGNTGTGVGFDVQRTVQNGDAAYFRSTTGLAGYITITGANTCTYNSVSDIRLKENIVDAPSALTTVESLQVRSFDWKDGSGNVPYGFIAQELDEVVPEAVSYGTTNEDGSMLTPWGIDTSLLVPYLTKAIQEQQAMIEQLKADVAALKGKV